MADYPPFQEGDALSPTTLDDKFDVLEKAVNEVETVSLKAFDHYHGTPSLVEPNIDFDTGSRFMGHPGHHNSTRDSSDEYKHSYSLHSSDNAVYLGFDSSQMALPSVQEGWKVIGENLPALSGTNTVRGRSDGKLECTYAQEISLVEGDTPRGPTLSRVGGILVLLNLEVLYFAGPTGDPSPVGVVLTDIEATVAVQEAPTIEYSFLGSYGMKLRAHFGIQVLVYGDGAELGWYNVKKSNRALSMPSSGRYGDLKQTGNWACGLATSAHRPTRGSMWKDVSIRTLITKDDLDVNGLAGLPANYSVMTVKGVRAVVCVEDGAAGAGDLWTFLPERQAAVVLKAYSMTTLALASDYNSKE